MADDNSSYRDPITDIITDALEAIIDTQSQDGLLKEFPIIGVPIKLYKAFNGIKDRIFLKKLSRFFEELSSVSEGDRIEFWTKYEGDEKEKQKLGDQIIIYLDRHDNLDKSALLARAFGAYIKEEITYSNFLDLAVLIDSVKIHHLDVVAAVLASVGIEISSYRNVSIHSKIEHLLPEMESQGLILGRSEVRMVSGKGFEKKERPVIDQEYKATGLAKNFVKHVIADIYKDAEPDVILILHLRHMNTPKP